MTLVDDKGKHKKINIWIWITHPSKRNLSWISMRWGDVKSPVRKPQLRNIDSVKVHVDPYKTPVQNNNFHHHNKQSY